MNLLTQQETAERLRCHRDTVLRMRKAGLLRSIGRNPVLIPELDVEAYIRGELATWVNTGEPIKAKTGSRLRSRQREVLSSSAGLTKQQAKARGDRLARLISLKHAR
jgi:excisionase family DNA binding protein